eukprot:753840-Hanusia_phi.AAC.3
MALVSPLVTDSINTFAFQRMWENARRGWTTQGIKTRRSDRFSPGKVKMYSTTADTARLQNTREKVDWRNDLSRLSLLVAEALIPVDGNARWLCTGTAVEHDKSGRIERRRNVRAERCQDVVACR